MASFAEPATECPEGCGARFWSAAGLDGHLTRVHRYRDGVAPTRKRNAPSTIFEPDRPARFPSIQNEETPMPTQFVCDECTPPREFSMERGLTRHRNYGKHRTAGRAVQAHAKPAAPSPVPARWPNEAGARKLGTRLEHETELFRYEHDTAGVRVTLRVVGDLFTLEPAARARLFELVDTIRAAAR